MDSNIDPEINAASDTPEYTKYDEQHQQQQQQESQQLHNGSAEDSAVDTATQALKVLAYQMPEEGEEEEEEGVDGKLKLDNKKYPYYDGDVKMSYNDKHIDDEKSENNKNDTIPDTSGKTEEDLANIQVVVPTSPPLQQQQQQRPRRANHHHLNNIDNVLNFVMMDPSTKEGLSKRLGRPKRMLNASETPQQSSLNNSSDSIISRFRFGSSRSSTISAHPSDSKRNFSSKFARGSSAIRKSKPRRVVQHTNGLKLVFEDQPNFDGPQLKQEQSTSSTLPAATPHSDSPPSTTIVIENINTLKAKGRSTAKDDPAKYSNRFRMAKTGSGKNSAAAAAAVSKRQ